MTLENGNVFTGTFEDFQPVEGKLEFWDGSSFEGKFQDFQLKASFFSEIERFQKSLGKEVVATRFLTSREFIDENDEKEKTLVIV